LSDVSEQDAGHRDAALGGHNGEVRVVGAGLLSRVDVWFARLLLRAPRWSSPVIGAVVVGLIVLTTFLDWLGGPRSSMLLGYTITVALSGWLLARRSAVLVAVGLSAATGWLIAIAPTDDTALSTIWLNALFRAGSLSLFAVIVAALRNQIVSSDTALGRDQLTGARSRRGVLDDLERLHRVAVHRGRPLSIVYLDLDELKRTNDELGHDAGDLLIRTFVEHLARNVRAVDRLGRLGGDEFLLVCPDTDADTARQLVGRVMSAPGAPSASWGIACTEHTADLDELRGIADRAMYAAKARRKIASQNGDPPGV
jgi:diguanylate cyclase (GGDEF)-like protein